MESHGRGGSPGELIDLNGPARERAVPVILDSFTGIYRWHAKRTLKSIPVVRGLEVEGAIVGISMLERLVPEVGYVYYIAVESSSRRKGFAGRLLDDALDGFRRQGAEVVYAAVREENHASERLFASREFRATERKERSYREGGLGAWGLRSRMWVVSGEVLMGLRIASALAGRAPPRAEHS